MIPMPPTKARMIAAARMRTGSTFKPVASPEHTPPNQRASESRSKPLARSRPKESSRKEGLRRGAGWWWLAGGRGSPSWPPASRPRTAPAMRVDPEPSLTRPLRPRPPHRPGVRQDGGVPTPYEPAHGGAPAPRAAPGCRWRAT